MPQLEKNQEILPSMPAEAFFHCGVSREIPPSLLSPERVLDTLEGTQDVPRHPCMYSSGTPMVPPQLKNCPGSPSLSGERVLFPASSRRESRCFHRTSRRGSLFLMLERNSRVHATIPKYPQMSQSTPDESDFLALPGLSP